MTAPDPRLGEIAARLSAAPGVHGMYSFHGSDVAFLLAALADRDAKLARVEALHRPVKKWEPYEGAGYSFNTREEALRAGGEEDLGVVAIEAGPQYFEVCAECSRVESEQLAVSGDEYDYRESLWPCKTRAAVADTTGGAE